MNDCFNKLQRAYKKLKSKVYFDKTQLALRGKIVDFEAGNQIDDCLKKMADILCDNDEKKWTSYSNRLLESVGALTFPKKLDINQKNQLIVNDSSPNTSVEDVQYFIDINVEGQILGVLWILCVGLEIDDHIYDHSYGNRVKKNIINEESKKTSFSPYLFEPYFTQYENWRDIGLKHAEACLENYQDVLILTLDFTRYFYNVHFDYEMFYEFLENYNKQHDSNSIVVKRINDFVYNVLKSYSELFTEYGGRVFLPIGFYPSNILSNWYLDLFDKGISNGLNPVYYGRYVDDVIIVEKIEQNSNIHDLILKSNNDGGLNEHKIIEQVFLRTGGSDQERLITKNGESYRLSQALQRSELSDLIFEMDKVKVFYFKHQGSASLLTCFRKEIRKNSSEFRFLPEDGEVFLHNDYSDIYSLDNSATINKFRGVEGLSIDKYAFSKFLSKNLAIGNLITDKLETGFERDIGKIFTNQVIIENYGTWDRMLLYLVINSRCKTYLDFIDRIVEAIEKTSQPEKEENHKINSVKSSLKITLFSAISKSLAHVWGPDVESHADQLQKKLGMGNLKEYRFNYCAARMCDKYVMPTLVDAYLSDDQNVLNDTQPINLTRFSDALKYGCNLSLESCLEYEYHPYMITPQDIMLSLTLDCIKNQSLIKTTKKLTEKMTRLYFKMNYHHVNDSLKLEDISVKEILTKEEFKEKGESEKTYAVRIGNGRKGKFRIAVANARTRFQDAVAVFTGAPVRTLDRYSRLSSIINNAIKSHADMLILPESYVPFEWIAPLARVCAKNQFALVTGVEHVKMDDKVYNLTATILPYCTEDYRYSFINFHTKVFYAPDEKRIINAYRLKEMQGQTYDLFVWNDLWFSTYCCYELTSIIDRSKFMSYVDMLAIVEWNKDVNYYSHIIDTLSRDIHCYCVQVNSSDYGDTRITMPSKTETKDILKTSGGLNETILIGEIDITRLRQFQFKGYELQKDDRTFKPTPPRFRTEIVHSKIQGTMWDEI